MEPTAPGLYVLFAGDCSCLLLRSVYELHVMRWSKYLLMIFQTLSTKISLRPQETNWKLHVFCRAMDTEMPPADKENSDPALKDEQPRFSSVRGGAHLYNFTQKPANSSPGGKYLQQQQQQQRTLIFL